MKQYLIPFLVGVAFIALGIVTYQMGRGAGYTEGINQPHKADTVVMIDTIVYDHPVEVTKWREKTVYVAVTDTQIVHTTDSVFVTLEREKKAYSGEDYAAVVSGIQPSLDEIKVFPKTVTITNTVVDKRRWTFGVTAGPGILYDGKIHGGIGIVAGLQYRF